MASNSEYEQRQLFERKLTWHSAKDLLANPKTYQIAGNVNSKVVFFKKLIDIDSRNLKQNK